MYCSSCGSAIPLNLTYCNRCGAKLAVNHVDTLAKPCASFPESLVFAMVATLVLGTGVLIGLMAVMRQVVGFDISQVLAMTMLIFTLMFVIEGFLIYLVLSERRDARKRQRLSERTARELEENEAGLLSEPMSSVTEHTTRAFEPVYVDQKSK
jgi:predicted amidophosphoribosyltransferase